MLLDLFKFLVFLYSAYLTYFSSSKKRKWDAISANVLRIKEVAESNLGEVKRSFLSAVI